MKKLLEKLFGRKYYAIVVDYMGNDSLSAQIYCTKNDAETSAIVMQQGRNQYSLHVISFRSRRMIVPEIINRNHVSYAKD